MDNLLIYLQSRLTIYSVVEMAVIAFCIYKILMWIKGTQAEQVAKGVIVLLIIVPLSNWLGFTTLNYLFNNLITWLIIIMAVVFQPELRSALENLGNKNPLFGFFNRKSVNSGMDFDIHQVLLAVHDLSRERIGALIVCEQQTGLMDIVGTGIHLNADISSELLENLFTPNRPLHDGAVVLSFKTGKVLGAGCLLPLTDKSALDTELGTRHRAAIGISEQSDALTIVVSEETGTISITERGQLRRNMRSGELEAILMARFAQSEEDSEIVKGHKSITRVLRSNKSQKEAEDEREE